MTAESDSSSTVAVPLPAVRCCPSSASHSLLGVEVNTQPLDAAAAVNGYQHYNYQREARTAVARRMEVEAQAAAASEENAARAAREEQSFQPTGETAGLGTFPGHFARAPGPEAAPWVNRDGSGQQQITRYRTILLILKTKNIFRIHRCAPGFIKEGVYELDTHSAVD